ncbi:MAG: hypothetical protein JNJ70_02635 [Verrucomicrobiales bacterium]|nr:hypothetical protein [Verrucomicrobiales bacterium]
MAEVRERGGLSPLGLRCGAPEGAAALSASKARPACLWRGLDPAARGPSIGAGGTPRHATQREALEQCLEKLPPTQRELVLNAYTKGTRMDDLAAQRGETAMALYKKLHRIRQALLECVRRTQAQEEPA